MGNFKVRKSSIKGQAQKQEFDIIPKYVKFPTDDVLPPHAATFGSEFCNFHFLTQPTNAVVFALGGLFLFVPETDKLLERSPIYLSNFNSFNCSNKNAQ